MTTARISEHERARGLRDIGRRLVELRACGEGATIIQDLRPDIPFITVGTSFGETMIDPLRIMRRLGVRLPDVVG